jgi:hypothetical protein
MPEEINDLEPQHKAPKRIKQRLERDLNSLRTAAEILGLFTDTFAKVLSDFAQSYVKNPPLEREELNSDAKPKS